MKPAPTGRKKRPRDDHLSSDDDAADSGSENNPERLGQAERKRELERNRRNLINVRFAELDAELRTHAPKSDALPLSHQQQQATKTKRIDKEAVLKEATQRLAVHRNDTKTLQERIALNTSEIENLRTEKAELRNDKAYLRSELDNVRGDVKRLRQDNINLWQALRKTSTLKNGLSQDVAKLPADLFLRPRTTTDEVAVNTPSSNNSLPRQTPSPQTQPTHQPQQLNASSALMTPNPGGGEQIATGNRHDPLAQSPCLQNIQPGAEAYLVLQSPEELGQLFSMAGSTPNNANNTANLSISSPTHAVRTPSLLGVGGGPIMSPPIGGISFAMAPPALNPNQTLKEDGQERLENQTTTNDGDEEVEGSVKLDGEDPLSDIAYCV